MPRRATYFLPAVEALPARMSLASGETLRRNMLAAEAIIPAIDPSQEYVLSDTLCSVVGNQFAPVTGKSAGLKVSGRELLGDLATLVLDLSARLSLDGTERPRGVCSPLDLARELGISSKTLQRWRANGLCVHWITPKLGVAARNGQPESADGRSTHRTSAHVASSNELAALEGSGAESKPRIAIYRECFERFVATHRLELDRACAFRRYDYSERTKLLEIGRALIAKGLTLNLAAKEAAHSTGRSHEGVRLLYLKEFGLQRERRRGAGDRAARFAERAWRLGIESSRIATHLSRSESMVRALVDRRRGEILRGVQPSWVELPTFDFPNADETVPNASAAKKPQLLGLVDGDVIASLASARALKSEFAKDTRAAAERDDTRAAAMHYLLRRASKAIDALPQWPDRAAIDQIETDLRAAVRLRTVLTERGLVFALGRADQYCRGGAERLPSDELRALAHAISSAVNAVVGSFDPSRQRFESAVNLAADLALAKLVNARAATRAAARHGSSVQVRLLGEVAQWQQLIDPMSHHAQRAAQCITARNALAADAKLLARRYGWCGHAPCTIETLATAERTTVALMSRRVRDAENALRRGV